MLPPSHNKSCGFYICPHNNKNTKKYTLNEGISFSMSLCCAFIYKGITYLATDSVSSIVLDYSIFGGNPIAYKPISFAEEKIIKLPIKNRHIFVTISGINKIPEISIKDLILKTDFDVNASVTILLNDIKEQFDKYSVINCFPGNRTEIRIFEYQKTGELHTDFFVYDWETQKIINNYHFEKFSYDSDLPKRFLSGQDWAKLVAHYVHFEKNEISTEDTVSRINEIYSRVKEASRYFDSTVGGIIRILKLTPDGYEWLQNPPLKDKNALL